MLDILNKSNYFNFLWLFIMSRKAEIIVKCECECGMDAANRQNNTKSKMEEYFLNPAFYILA